MDHPLLASEPEFGPWVVVPEETVANRLAASIQPGGRGVIAVDGRSGSGKTTTASRIQAVLNNSTVVHTDDVAWHHSFFAWSDLMIAGVLAPFRHEGAVDFRPPAWVERKRSGSIEVDARARWLIVEGVGAARHELMPYVDAVLWVQSDFTQARARGIERDGGDGSAAAFWDEWMGEELGFLDEHRPWERANVIVSGTPTGAVPPGYLMIAARSSGA